MKRPAGEYQRVTVRAVAAAHPLGGSTCMAGLTIVGLGLAAAVLEGAGLFLFIPLLQSLRASSSQSGKWQPIFDQLLAPVPEQLRKPC